MAATTNTTKTDSPTAPFGVSVDEAADRIRALNEKIIEAGKQTGNVSLDAYEKSLASIVEFEEKAANATNMEWVTTLTKAHTTFLMELSKAYTTAARDLLK